MGISLMTYATFHHIQPRELTAPQVMHDIMVKPLPAGCRLTAIFDSCHSGSSLDLPYIVSPIHLISYCHTDFVLPLVSILRKAKSKNRTSQPKLAKVSSPLSRHTLKVIWEVFSNPQWVLSRSPLVTPPRPISMPRQLGLALLTW